MNDPSADKRPRAPVWRCAVPTPLRRCFDYRPASGWQRDPAPGTRVTVPFGRQKVTAVLLATAGESEVADDKLRAASEVLDTKSLYPPPLLALLTWAAGYYHHPIGEVLPLGLSPGERRGKPERQLGEAGVALTERGRGLAPGAPHRAPQQARLVSLLEAGPLSLSELAAHGISRTVVKALIERELAAPCEVHAEQDWRLRSAPLEPNSEQQNAINAISAAAGGFSVHLLYGVTGSGKTEVYLQSIASCLTRGEQALILLPEIALTPQTLSRFESRFAAPVVTLHSGMGDAERDRAWAAARQGSAAIILGTRSAVFVPLKKLGLLIIDEEHDAAFVQQDGLRYSARDVAIKRGQLEQCPVVLGSATPSLESWHNAERGRYRRHTLPCRAGSGVLPRQQLIDVSGLELSAGLSPELVRRIDSTLQAGHQVMVFLNRRGFAAALMCHDCGWSSDCPDCDARMTLHKTPSGLHCHHCGRRAELPRQCPDCGSGRLVGAGLGTQQTEAFLQERFSTFPVIRVDSDNMTGREAMSQLVQRVLQGDPVLMIGTQMLSKGHHFPHVTLVAVVDADALLFSPDFRGEERLLQLLTQVSGRAGREATPGEVLIQTRHPQHPLIQQLEAPYDSALPLLLSQRSKAGLPPEGALAVIRCDSENRQEGMTFLSELKRSQAVDPDYQMIGPIPAAMARRKNRYRTQLVVTARGRAKLSTIVTSLVAVAESTRHSHRLKWFVDVDPYESL